jgi:SAM-dependent methyltransferase
MELPELGDRRRTGGSSAQSEVENAIRRLVDELRQEVAADAVDAVISKIRFGEPVDYDQEWKAFTAAYLLVNYRKMVTALRPIPLGATETVVDAGCGVGPASLALLTVLAEAGRRGPATIHLVDRSSPQLPVGQRLVARVARVLGLATEVHTRCADLLTRDPTSDVSIVLMSHVLGEQSQGEANRILSHMGGELASRGSLLAVERGDDNPWGPQRLAPVDGCEVDEGAFTAWAPAPSSAIAPERGWHSRWLLATRNVTWMADLVDAYFRAWNTQDMDAVSAIFHADADYHEKPTDLPIHGVDAIREYWRSHVLPQEDPVARATLVRFGPVSAALEWTATFTEQGNGRIVQGQMHLDFDPHTRTIRALREVFRTAATKVQR